MSSILPAVETDDRRRLTIAEEQWESGAAEPHPAARNDHSKTIARAHLGTAAANRTLRIVQHDRGYVILCWARVKALEFRRMVAVAALRGTLWHAHRWSPMQPEDTSRTKSEHVLDDARRLVEASRRSLAEGAELVRQCRDIIQRAEDALPLERVARASTRKRNRPRKRAEKTARP